MRLYKQQSEAEKRRKLGFLSLLCLKSSVLLMSPESLQISLVVWWRFRFFQCLLESEERISSSVSILGDRQKLIQEIPDPWHRFLWYFLCDCSRRINFLLAAQNLSPDTNNELNGVSKFERTCTQLHARAHMRAHRHTYIHTVINISLQVYT